MIQRLWEGIAWRVKLRRLNTQRLRFLRSQFQNADELYASLAAKTPCEKAILKDGTNLKHPPGRTGFAQMLLEVWWEEVYTGRFYTPQPGHVIIDAGANIGSFSTLIATRQPTAKVWSFEPFAENFAYLQQNLAAVKATHVTPLQAGLSGASGTAIMEAVGTRSQDHRIQENAVGNGAVPIYSFGDVLAMTGSLRVDLFKCDIEGSEHDLFAAAKPDALKRVDRYAIEYHDNIRPGTLQLLKDKLKTTHSITVKEDPGGYGMLYAAIKS